MTRPMNYKGGLKPRRTVDQRTTRTDLNDAGNEYRKTGWRKEALEMYMSREFTLTELATVYGYPQPERTGKTLILKVVQREALLELMRVRHAEILSDLEEFQ